MSGTRADARKAREDCERCRVALEVKRRQQRREVTQQALAAVWSGADFTDADAVLDQLADLGARVEIDG